MDLFYKDAIEEEKKEEELFKLSPAVKPGNPGAMPNETRKRLIGENPGKFEEFPEDQVNEKKIIEMTDTGELVISEANTDIRVSPFDMTTEIEKIFGGNGGIENKPEEEDDFEEPGDFREEEEWDDPLEDPKNRMTEEEQNEYLLGEYRQTLLGLYEEKKEAWKVYNELQVVYKSTEADLLALMSKVGSKESFDESGNRFRVSHKSDQTYIDFELLGLGGLVSKEQMEDVCEVKEVLKWNGRKLKKLAKISKKIRDIITSGTMKPTAKIEIKLSTEYKIDKSEAKKKEDNDYFDNLLGSETPF